MDDIRDGYNPQTDEVNPIQLGRFRPLGAWAYFGYSLLYSIPFIGLIFLIVFSFDDSNRNRRNHARSYWCGLLIAIILIVIIVIIGLAVGLSFTDILNKLPKQ